MENPKGAHKGGKKKPAGGDVQKQCAECEQSKPRDAFSKTQWARDERKCAECIAKGKAEGHETEKILEVVPDEVVELTSEGIDDFVARASQMLETLELQPDQACSDRGRPGTCSSLEYCQVKTTVRLSLHPHLYLRSMSYVGHYQREGVSFATPSIVVQVNELKRVPAAIVALLKPNEDKIVSSLRVWTFRGCPKTINIMSHGFVFEGQDAAKAHRNVSIGCFGAVGVSQISLPVGRMHEKVRVSVHKSRGMMACSPNNAILGVEFDCPGLRRFWIMVRDGNRVELSVNALICDDRDCEDLSAVMQRVAAKGNQTDLAVCLQELLANKSTFVLASFMNTFV